jgi:hypothetical protein
MHGAEKKATPAYFATPLKKNLHGENMECLTLYFCKRPPVFFLLVIQSSKTCTGNNGHPPYDFYEF